MEDFIGLYRRLQIHFVNNMTPSQRFNLKQIVSFTTSIWGDVSLILMNLLACLSSRHFSIVCILVLIQGFHRPRNFGYKLGYCLPL
jgi:hypothetical protein